MGKPEGGGVSNVFLTCLLTVTNQQPKLNIFTIIFHFRHTLFLHDLLIHLFFPFHMSDHHLAKGLLFLCHWSTTLEFTTSLYPPKLDLFTNLPFQAQNLFKIASPPKALFHLPGLSTRILIFAILILFIFSTQFLCEAIIMYPENPEGTQLIVGSMNMG